MPDPTDRDLLAFLQAHGLSMAPEGLDPLLAEAIASLKRTLYRDDPKADLPPAEAAALERGGFSFEPPEAPAASPLATSTALYAALLETALDTAELARRLRVDPSRVRQRLTSRPPSLYGIRRSAGWAIPVFQLAHPDADRLVPGVGRVVARLPGDLHPVAVYRWFTTPTPDLAPPDGAAEALSPRDWLLAGLDVEAVEALAGEL